MAAKDLKVAIVCDWLVGYGGAERVVLELHRLYPDAPIYTSQYDPKKITWFKNADVRTTWLQKLPHALKKFLPPLRALAFSQLNLSEYDLVISSSGAEAKGVKTGPNTVHVCYMHAPTHYYWSRYEQYMKHPGFGVFNPLARLGLKLLVGPMRRWDKKAAQRPNHLIANSSHIKKEIKKYYGRTATVIHPPVDIQRLASNKRTTREGFVIAGRQTPYKRIDLAVQACSQLNLPLTVIGGGPEHAKLVRMAGPTITFVPYVGDDEIGDYFRVAKGFIFPGLDDFGITPVEAMAAGTPVIAYKAGGALDYVTEGKTGIFFAEQTPESLIQAIHKFNVLTFDPISVSASTKQFSIDRFHKEIREFIRKI